jgi:hypothetical protein
MERRGVGAWSGPSWPWFAGGKVVIRIAGSIFGSMEPRLIQVLEYAILGLACALVEKQAQSH